MLSTVRPFMYLAGVKVGLKGGTEGTSLARTTGHTQGDRILSCSGEHRPQGVFLETTEEPFLAQPDGLCGFWAQQMAGDVPPSRPICRRLILAAPGVGCLACPIEG